MIENETVSFNTAVHFCYNIIVLEQIYKSDIADLKAELEQTRKTADKEKIRGSELERKLASTEQQMK